MALPIETIEPRASFVQPWNRDTVAVRVRREKVSDFQE